MSDYWRASYRPKLINLYKDGINEYMDSRIYIVISNMVLYGNNRYTVLAYTSRKCYDNTNDLQPRTKRSQWSTT